MCGFVGFVSSNKRKKTIVKKMAGKIKHRGPDGEAYHIGDDIALASRHLSFSDLNNELIYSEDKSLVIALDGEIYNCKELKKDLLKKDYIFNTQSCAEVVLHGYEEYGVEILNKLRGMFAFVIYDNNKKELFGARDFYGIKPLYYTQMNNTFMFSSEIKAFLPHPDFNKELNRKALENYLTFQYSKGPETFFKNVYKLTPGHCFIYKDNKLTIKKYYEFSFDINDDKPLEALKQDINKVIAESIRVHKKSNVEVGAFLSSGVDSSYITKASKVKKTFTVGFENKDYSEVDHVKDFASKFKIKNISKIITKNEYFKEFPKIQYHMDEPLADPAAIALYFLSNLASGHVKVCLSGEGADEIFGGYNIYHEPFSVSWYNKIPFFIRRLIGKVASLLPKVSGINFLVRRGKRLEERYVGNAFIFDSKERKKILSFKTRAKDYKELTKPYYDKVKELDDVAKMQYIDFNFWMVDDILLKADKMSMANSLEVRVPFLDKKVVDLGRQIPTKYKVTKTTTKYAYRLVAKEILEDDVADKKKLGFPVPIREWIKEEDTYNHIKTTFLRGNRFFNTRETLKLLDEHIRNKKDNSRKIWTLYTFLIWYQQYF
ncbi:MAG TPA: asparagine synthase (glutamine-hydrolyzing) [Mollicutes bacterium]|nr:asparagine synthase (glutamine-hydrolyzing) [Mollicutes bacterium]